mgnify:CR=1 FL=1
MSASMCLPSWFRFAQCLRKYHDTHQWFPNLAGAFKYFLKFIVITFYTLKHTCHHVQSPLCDWFFYFWVGVSFVSSMYAWIWDVWEDWGLFSRDAGDNFFLRKKLIYPKWFYYFAMVENFVLRFGWATSAWLTKSLPSPTHDHLLAVLFASLKVFRRFIWNFLKMEMEHLKSKK